MKKHLELMENAQNLNETFSKGDKVVVKSSVKNPQVKKYAGKEATVTGTEDDGKTIHAKVKGAKHGSMEFKASEIEAIGENLNEDVDTDKAKKDLQSKIKKIEDAISDFKDMSDNTAQLIDALPKGVSQFSALNKQIGELQKELDSLNNKLINAQDWDSNKL